jgi:Tfp pilus assembly protein FimV
MTWILVLIAVFAAMASMAWGEDIIHTRKERARAEASERRATQLMAEQLAEKDRQIELARAAMEKAAATIQQLQAQLTALQAQVVAKPAAANQPVDFRFRKLRALILQELHPDHAPAGSAERALKQEVFKSLWPKIEAIAGKEAA